MAAQIWYDVPTSFFTLDNNEIDLLKKRERERNSMFSSQLLGILGKCSQDADARLTQATSPPKSMEILCFHVNEHQEMLVVLNSPKWILQQGLKRVIPSMGPSLAVSVPPAGYPSCGKSL